MLLLTINLRTAYLLEHRSRREHVRLVDDRATTDVEGWCGNGAGMVRDSEGGHIVDIVKRRCPLEHRQPNDRFGYFLVPIGA
jgi:hypothetical protein